MYWQRSLVVAWLMPRETAAVSAQVLCTPFNHTPVFRPSTTTSRDVEEQGKCAHKGRRDGELMFRHRYLRQSNKMSNDWYHRSQLDKGKWRNKQNEGEVTLGGRAQELCESFTKLPLVGWLQFFGLNWSRGGHPGPPVLFSYDLSGRKASLNLNWNLLLLFIACI